MSIEQLITKFDEECDALTPLIDAKRPERTFDAYMELRARSLGRSFLRAAQAVDALTLERFEAFYSGARRRAVSDDGQQS